VTFSNFLHSGFLLTVISPGDAAPRLSPSKLVLICDMIESESFATSETAEEAECSKETSSVSARTCDNLEAFTHDKPELVGNEL
jgi:hypothetical protein